MSYDQYATLAISHQVPDHVVRPEEFPIDSRLHPSSPALTVLQDFRQYPPTTLLDKLNLEQALSLFKLLQLRYLLVENTAGDFQGILAAADVLGPKLMTRMRLQQALPEELQVSELMIPRKDLWSVPYASLAKAKIGDVLHTMEVGGQMFLCVHDGRSPTSANLRGVFCARDIAEKLGERWAPPLRAQSFSELRSTLLGKAELTG